MEEEVKKLRFIIAQRNEEIAKLKFQLENQGSFSDKFECSSQNFLSMSQNEISRYSRQLILPEIGVTGQISLKRSAVLIVGAGGLGCPVAIYLAAAGIGRIGIVDHDIVDISNLHRQIGHTVGTIGQDKSKSLMCTLKNINPEIKCSTYSVLLNSTNIEKVIEPYSIIVDASDNVPTRYLLNDAAVLYNKCLVSGSALRFEGQLTIYNYLDGPCYRCLFPIPPSEDAVTNCSNSGVLGAVTGVIGCLQAMEVIKISAGLQPSYNKKMLLFDGLHGDIRVIKLRNKKPDCDVCGNEPTVKKLIDYEMFCNRLSTDKNISFSILSDLNRISCSEYKKILDNGTNHILLDVRPSHEIDICSLPNSLNIPINVIAHEDSVSKIRNLIEEKKCKDSFVVCRRGNDSQKAVNVLEKLIPHCFWRDIKGGLYAWHDEVDSTFPVY